MRSDWAAVQTLSAGIQDFTDFLRQFHNKILPTATLDDRASADSAAFAARSKNRSAKFRNRCAATCANLPKAATVQDELITFAAKRFVIPVKVEQKRRVQGVVHGASSSGQTVSWSARNHGAEQRPGPPAG